MSRKYLSKKDERRYARIRRRLFYRVFLISVIVIFLAVTTWLLWFSKPAKPGNTQTLVAGGPTPHLVGTKQYSAAPPMLIDVTKQYLATVRMAKGGEFVIQLYPDKAPITVNSFVFLANQGFFNGVTFHRVIKGFMAQGGDPTGTGGGGPGYQFINELNDLKFDKAGVVAMANAGPNTNGSQFFITFGPYSGSERDYTIFGQIISGMDIVNSITPRDPGQNPTFTGDSIESITISEK
jgi:cyclophilin family peptidyl-prolyl cis-trans isomerase